MYFIKRFIIQSIFIFFRIFKIKNNKIVITSYYGKGYGDNSKYICEEIFKRNLNVQIVWLVNNLNEKFPDDVKKVKYKSILSLYELATAKIWIDNSRKQEYILKRKGQYYIQTWHSSLRLKKIEKDAINELPIEYIRNAKSDSKKIDLLTVGCKYSEEIFDRAFWYSGTKLCCGTPRCDLFFNKKIMNKLKKEILKKYELKDKKIILYAPTFKKSQNYEKNLLELQKLISILGNKYVIFVKLHPVAISSVESIKNVYDYTNYPDIQELIAICDILITDYSSCCFDAMIAKKPCILYTPDLNQYLKNERSLYFDLSELPFDKIMTLDNLVKKIKNFNYEEYISKIKKFQLKIGSYEKGVASKTIVDKIEKIM